MRYKNDGGNDMKHFDGDSFGSDCPENWEEIVDYLNDRLDYEVEILIKEKAEEIWENYCSGRYADAPEAIFAE